MRLVRFRRKIWTQVLTLPRPLRQAITKTFVRIERGDMLYAGDRPGMWLKPVLGASGWFMALRHDDDGWWSIVRLFHVEEER